MSGENDDIVVTGSRYQPILDEWQAQHHTIDEEGVGGGGPGGGGGRNSNTQSARVPSWLDQ